jgi:DNA-binding response OmpR family regulator
MALEPRGTGLAHLVPRNLVGPGVDVTGEALPKVVQRMDAELPRHQTIVVINDSPELLELARLLFEDEGYDVKVAQVGTGAFDLIRHTLPDLVILDVRLPDISGWDILQAMKLERAMASIPVLVCTAAVNELRELEDNLRQIGVDTLIKPFAIDALLSKVEALIEGRTPAEDESEP